MAELQIPTKIIGLKLLLLQILGFAVSVLLTFCYRTSLNSARGCAPGIARNARLFWFWKQPLEAGENIRDDHLGPSAVGVCAKMTRCFTPVCGRRREKRVVRSQRSIFGLNRGGPTQHSGRRLRGHPSSAVKIDCILR